jgi:phosphatidylserine/phosphatidylglycerophosphate/cardiolipin synthase-like enzyme
MLCRLILTSALLSAGSIAAAQVPTNHGANWSVYFSPNGGAEAAVVAALKAAQSTVFVQAYSFTNAAIAKALVAAHERGISVQVILDRSNRTAHYSAATFITNAGIPTAIDSNHAIAHNKVMIIDAATVITGSYNFTRAAESANAENLLVIHDPEIAARYLANWKAHQAHSRPPRVLDPRARATTPPGAAPHHRRAPHSRTGSP